MPTKSYLSDEQLIAILQNGNYVTTQDIKIAQKYAKGYQISVVDHLIAKDVITKDLLGQAIAEYFKVPYADLNSNQPSKEQVLRISEESAREYRIVLFDVSPKDVTVTTDRPDQKKLAQVLRVIFPGITIRLAYSLPEDIDEALAHYRKNLKTQLNVLIKKEGHIAPEILNAIFDDAITYDASDIHLEPQPQEVIVRFRIDGILHKAGNLPKGVYENMVNRIKVMAHLRIDEHFATQDGSIRYLKEDQPIDMRVSIVPTLEGEKIAIRLLAKYVQGFSLSDLGISENDGKILEEASRRPFGMILVTGPTGSGKTTTLYALLKLLNKPDVNITTIEDPVEYKIFGVNQIQVNPRTDLTFAKGLRSIVRQDPNIILVGEIRDEETAEISVNAALTGHLLLSTFHANDAPTAIPRLLDMGIEPFLLASTLEVVIAQRLVRRICEHCRYSKTMTLSKISERVLKPERFFSQKNNRLYAGKGCSNCEHTGYKGRIAIFEIIRVTQELEDLILQRPSAQQIWHAAFKSGARTLFDDGIEKVKNGITTLSELLRVAQPPQ